MPKDRPRGSSQKPSAAAASTSQAVDASSLEAQVAAPLEAGPHDQAAVPTGGAAAGAGLHPGSLSSGPLVPGIAAPPTGEPQVAASRAAGTAGAGDASSGAVSTDLAGLHARLVALSAIVRRLEAERSPGGEWGAIAAPAPATLSEGQLALVHLLQLDLL
jgi:hypothetical protein